MTSKSGWSTVLKIGGAGCGCLVLLVVLPMGCMSCQLRREAAKAQVMYDSIEKGMSIEEVHSQLPGKLFLFYEVGGREGNGAIESAEGFARALRDSGTTGVMNINTRWSVVRTFTFDIEFDADGKVVDVRNARVWD